MIDPLILVLLIFAGLIVLGLIALAYMTRHGKGDGVTPSSPRRDVWDDDFSKRWDEYDDEGYTLNLDPLTARAYGRPEFTAQPKDPLDP